jgi:hypothetical protein
MYSNNFKLVVLNCLPSRMFRLVLGPLFCFFFVCLFVWFFFSFGYVCYKGKQVYLWGLLTLIVLSNDLGFVVLCLIHHSPFYRIINLKPFRHILVALYKFLYLNTTEMCGHSNTSVSGMCALWIYFHLYEVIFCTFLFIYSICVCWALTTMLKLLVSQKNK